MAATKQQLQDDQPADSKEQQFASEDIIPASSATVWKSTSPEEQANFFSRLIFWWVQPLFSRASVLRRQGDVLQQDDLVPLANIDQGGRILSIFDAHYAKNVEKLAAQRAAAAKADADGNTSGKKMKGKKKRDAAAQSKKELELQLKRRYLP